MKLTRISCPAHEYDACRFIAHTVANTTQQINTRSEKREVSPKRGKFSFFRPQFLHILLKIYKKMSYMNIKDNIKATSSQDGQCKKIIVSIP